MVSKCIRQYFKYPCATTKKEQFEIKHPSEIKMIKLIIEQNSSCKCCVSNLYFNDFLLSGVISPPLRIKIKLVQTHNTILIVIKMDIGVYTNNIWSFSPVNKGMLKII